MLSFILILSSLPVIYTLDNNLALRPPMGWSSWLEYGCASCDSQYNIFCLSETSIKEIADTLANEGYLSLGYQTIILDDGWQDQERDGNRKLRPNYRRFPSGIRTLADYIHNKNLKFGIFSDLGPWTGCGFPGSAGYYKEDADTFAEWGVDYVKMSGATAYFYTMDMEYPKFGYYLHETNRPMLYATSWPAFQQYYDKFFQVNYLSVAAYSNTWRFYGDVQSRWDILLDIMDFYASMQDTLTKVVKAGAWNDADLLVVGRNGVTLDQCTAQMVVWAIIPSPLIVSANLKSLTDDQKALLKNQAIIAIHQDQLCLPGRRLRQESNIDIWIRPISPSSNGMFSYAIAFVNRNEFGIPINYTTTLYRLGLFNISGYYITDLLPSSNTIYRQTPMSPSSVLQMQMKPSSVVFLKAEIVTSQSIYFPFMPLPTDNIVRY